jgi:hypothetical protein
MRDEKKSRNAEYKKDEHEMGRTCRNNMISYIL